MLACQITEVAAINAYRAAALAACIPLGSHFDQWTDAACLGIEQGLWGYSLNDRCIDGQQLFDNRRHLR